MRPRSPDGRGCRLERAGVRCRRRRSSEGKAGDLTTVTRTLGFRCRGAPRRAPQSLLSRCPLTGRMTGLSAAPERILDTSRHLVLDGPDVCRRRRTNRRRRPRWLRPRKRDGGAASAALADALGADRQHLRAAASPLGRGPRPRGRGVRAPQRAHRTGRAGRAASGPAPTHPPPPAARSRRSPRPRAPLAAARSRPALRPADPRQAVRAHHPRTPIAASPTPRSRSAMRERMFRVEIIQDAFCERRPKPQRLFRKPSGHRSMESWCDLEVSRYPTTRHRCAHCNDTSALFKRANDGDWKAEVRLHRLATRASMRLLAERRAWADTRRRQRAARTPRPGPPPVIWITLGWKRWRDRRAEYPPAADPGSSSSAARPRTNSCAPIRASCNATSRSAAPARATAKSRANATPHAPPHAVRRRHRTTPRTVPLSPPLSPS